MSVPETPLLSIRELVVSYESGRRRGEVVTAVSGVSLDIAAGSIFALVGESGAGKTSLAQAILQLVPASGGRVGVRCLLPCAVPGVTNPINASRC